MTPRFVAASLLALVVVVAGCGSARTTTLAAKGPDRLQPLATRCGEQVKEKVKTGWFRAADGSPLDGAALGSGKAGVVLAHQYPNSLCGWVPYARVLSRAGFRVLLIDHRGFGSSPSPAGQAKQGDYASDLVGAADELKREGASKVFLMGASFGGITSMVAGSELGSRIAGVVSVSGETSLGTSNLDALSAVPKLRAPFLIVGSREDDLLPVPDARKLLQRAGSKHKRLVLFPSSYHGWDILMQAPYRAQASADVIEFLKRYA